MVQLVIERQGLAPVRAVGMASFVTCLVQRISGEAIVPFLVLVLMVHGATL